MRFNLVWCILLSGVLCSQISSAKSGVGTQSINIERHPLASRLANAFWVYDDPTTHHSIVFELGEHSHNKGYYFYREWKYDCHNEEKPLYRIVGVPENDNGEVADFYISSGYDYRPFLTQLHLVKLKPKKYVILSKETPDGVQKYRFDYQTENKARCQFKS
ncbi:hypothetical protein [Moraxella sp.]|uniref:hypothetical protein n=1 Tax=Moraxella sp. TaxID=479 RepID=UPI0026DBD8DD|nr:hypothetical protein [Moraxella sp.]MDO4894082.1 hypothetical protein [Moraxella sp.]